MSEFDSRGGGPYTRLVGLHNPNRVYHVASTEIEIILGSLEKPVKEADVEAVKKLFLEIVAQRHASTSQIEDLFFAACWPLSEIDREIPPERWCEILSIPTRNYGSATDPEGAVPLTLSVECADLAELLIKLEGLGYAIDPRPLVLLLQPWISRQEYVSEAEIGILWYQRERHCSYPIELRACSIEDAGAHARHFRAFITATGYTVDVERNDLGRPVALTVTAPRFLAV